MSKPSELFPDHPAYSVDAHLARVKELHASYRLRTEKACDAHTIGLLRKIVDRNRIPEQLIEGWHTFIDTLYRDADLYILYVHDLRLPNYLQKIQQNMTEPGILEAADKVVVAFFKDLIEILPDAAYAPVTASTLSCVPVVDLLPARYVVALCISRFSDEFHGRYIFPSLRYQLSANRIKASGYDPDTYKGQKLTGFSEFKGGGHAIINAYLDDTPFISLLADPVPFQIEDAVLAQHAAIFAPTGHGKTQLLQSIIVQQLQKPDPPPMFIIDNMGTMLRKIERLKLFDGPLKERLVILDPADAPPLNLFKFKASQSLYFYLFKAIEQSLTTRQATMVAYLMDLMQSIPDATLATLRGVLARTIEPDLTHVHDEDVRDYFLTRFNGKDQQSGQTRQQLADRLFTIARHKAFNRMLSAKDNIFDPYRFIEERKIVLIPTEIPTDDPREAMDDASKIYGRFLIAQIMGAVRRRRVIPEKDRHLALLVIDEAKNYFDEMTEEILNDARQLGLGMIFATQHLGQLPDRVRDAMFSNAATKFAGRLQYDHAGDIARDMGTSREFIMSMQGFVKGRDHPSEFAAHVRNLTSEAVRLFVPYGILESLPQRTVPQRSPISPEPPPTAPPEPTTFAVGDRVQVTMNGMDMFPGGTIITGIQVQGTEIYVLVEGSDAGTPLKDVRPFQVKRHHAEPSSTASPDDTDKGRWD